jgi:hypothetical protein
MLNKKELLKIRKALPKDGYERISVKLDGRSTNSIRMILTDPKRYDKEVIDIALVVAVAYKDEMLAQKAQVKSTLS